MGSFKGENTPLARKARQVRRLWFDGLPPEKQDDIIWPIFEKEVPREEIEKLAAQIPVSNPTRQLRLTV